MSLIEVAAALLGILNVVLVVRRSLWNYPFGLAMVTLYGFVFFDAKLYSDALLQGFFFAVNLYGWWNWSRSRAASGEVRVEVIGTGGRIAWIAACLIVTLSWGLLMDRATDAHWPLWDGAIAVLSIAAQILQSRRKLEAWALWIAVDLLAVPLFAVKRLWPTAGLYVVFLVLAVWGLIGWHRARARA